MDNVFCFYSCRFVCFDLLESGKDKISLLYIEISGKNHKGSCAFQEQPIQRILAIDSGKGKIRD
jgi:hypothetical protein